MDDMCNRVIPEQATIPYLVRCIGGTRRRPRPDRRALRHRAPSRRQRQVTGASRRLRHVGRRGHTGGRESKASTVGLSQRVSIIGETCLHSLNRLRTAVCQCERALLNVERPPRI